MKKNSESSKEELQVDHTSSQEFYDYYAKESESEKTLSRFYTIRDIVIRVLGNSRDRQLDVADIGCGAGVQSMIWSQMGHKVFGIDINEPLVSLARKRAEEKSLNIAFEVGVAQTLPWDDASMDVCLVPELLEHVVDWESCLDEFARILRPGGVLYISTNNVLCPIQQEFNLPLYSWYPAPLKRYYEKIAVTSKPHLVNHATYPAVNWFSYYGLRREMYKRGFLSMDRFDIVDRDKLSSAYHFVLDLICSLPPLRLVSHMMTPYTMIVSIRR